MWSPPLLSLAHHTGVLTLLPPPLLLPREDRGQGLDSAATVHPIPPSIPLEATEDTFPGPGGFLSSLRVRGPASSLILEDKDQGSRDLGTDRLGELQRWERSCSGSQVTCWKRSWETPAGPCPLRGTAFWAGAETRQVQGLSEAGSGAPCLCLVFPASCTHRGQMREALPPMANG